MGATSPLYDLLNQIKQASDTKLYLLSLTAVVALPDICVSLESTEGRSNGVAYRAWCAANVGGVFPFITPDDLYSMRCGVVHNGTLSGMKHDVKRVIFVPPAGVSIVGNFAGDAYIYSAVEFCQTFCIAVHGRQK